MAAQLHKAIKSPQGFADSVDKYIEHCKASEELATIVGLSLALDCDKGQLSKWLDKYSKPNEHDSKGLIAHAIKRVKAYSEHQLTQECFKKNKAMALALGKCMHGWVEQQHVKHEHTGGVELSIATGVPKG